MLKLYTMYIEDKEMKKMIYVAMFLTALAMVVFYLIQYVIGSANNKQSQMKVENERLQLELERQKLKMQKAINDEQTRYLIDLKEEEQRIIEELDHLDRKSLPTREQLDKMMWYMRSEGQLTQAQSNQLRKIFDVRGLYSGKK